MKDQADRGPFAGLVSYWSAQMGKSGYGAQEQGDEVPWEFGNDTEKGGYFSFDL